MADNQAQSVHNRRMLRRVLIAVTFLCLVLSWNLGVASALLPTYFYVQKTNIVDPTIQQLISSGKLKIGVQNTAGVTGSTIDVKNTIVQVGPNKNNTIPSAIRLHTPGNTSITRSNIPKWTRWYQEDGRTQVFRLFKGDYNVVNTRPNARVEAFSEHKWRYAQDTWNTWTGTFLIVKPLESMIFQIKNDDNDWACHIWATANGDLKLDHRRGQSDVIIAQDMIHKHFTLTFRDNGKEYEVFLDGLLVGAGAYDRPTGYTKFRWGMYCAGANPVATNDALLFVVGAKIAVEKGASPL